MLNKGGLLTKKMLKPVNNNLTVIKKIHSPVKQATTLNHMSPIPKKIVNSPSSLSHPISLPLRQITQPIKNTNIVSTSSLQQLKPLKKMVKKEKTKKNLIHLNKKDRTITIDFPSQDMLEKKKKNVKKLLKTVKNLNKKELRKLLTEKKLIKETSTAPESLLRNVAIGILPIVD